MYSSLNPYKSAHNKQTQKVEVVPVWWSVWASLKVQSYFLVSVEFLVLAVNEALQENFAILSLFYSQRTTREFLQSFESRAAQKQMVCCLDSVRRFIKCCLLFFFLCWVHYMNIHKQIGMFWQLVFVFFGIGGSSNQNSALLTLESNNLLTPEILSAGLKVIMPNTYCLWFTEYRSIV